MQEAAQLVKAHVVIIPVGTAVAAQRGRRPIVARDPAQVQKVVNFFKIWLFKTGDWLTSRLTRFLSCIAEVDEMGSDPHDDYCPPGKIILCPPGAENNKDCKCLDDPDKNLAKDF